MSLDDLEAVTHVAPPKELPLAILKDAVKLIDIPPGAIGATGASEVLVQQVATSCATYSDRIVKARSILGDGINLWGAQIVENQAERGVALRAIDDAVNSLKARNTVGKLNKLDLTKDQIARANEGREVLAWIDSASAAAGHIADVVAYLREAVDVFGAADPISVDALQLRSDLLDLFRTGALIDAAKVASLKALGEDLRRRFADAAVAAHHRDRLDGAGDDRKRRILEGGTYADLGRLSAIDILPGGKYAGIQQKLTDLRTCKNFDPSLLARSVTCSECSYRPRPAGGPTAQAILEQLEEQTTSLRAEWERALADSVSVPEMAEQINLLKPADKKTVSAFVASRQLPEPIDQAFVTAIGQVLTRFAVRRVAVKEIWNALFPESAPATLDELSSRFRDLLDNLAAGGPADRIRIVPAEETNS
jgi:hypothetical protein